ncbi:circumsporozoite protein-like, partial [Myiozetetes cayanensis]|uniref:circumsporozoite protein-like n=1 Tax=Myiozetetes cayanensis TaxID=478635 RepID=UPI00215F1084
MQKGARSSPERRKGPAQGPLRALRAVAAERNGLPQKALTVAVAPQAVWAPCLPKMAPLGPSGPSGGTVGGAEQSPGAVAGAGEPQIAPGMWKSAAPRAPGAAPEGAHGAVKPRERPQCHSGCHGGTLTAGLAAWDSTSGPAQCRDW